MSPASCDAAFEVERYIGACLFTKRGNNYHPDNNHQNVVNYRHREGWAGGAPLISFNDNHRRPGHHQHHHRYEQLAQYARGAPLIVTKNHFRAPPPRYNYVQQQHTKVFESSRRPKNGPQMVDTASVTSDESYGSQNSEPCLPRILKPRKRRKKDRKPPARSHNDHQYSPYIEPSPVNDAASEVPKLHHSFEEVEEVEDLNNNNSPSTCQCRYCDPNCQIWDVDRSCYSPYLTPPSGSFEFSSLLQSSPDLPYGLSNELSRLSLKEGEGVGEETRKPVFSRSSSNSSSAGSSLEVSTEIVTSPNGHRDIEIKFWLSGDGGGAGDRSVQDDVGS